jgi:pilus assembly protein CpaC
MKRPLAILLLVIMVLPPTARAGQVAARASNAVGETAAVEQLDLLVGRSTVIRMERPITRVSLSTPDIADALVTTPYEVLIHGKVPGTISMMVWEGTGRIKTFDVAVRRDLSQLDTQLQKLFPGEAITATSNGKDVVLSGFVSSKYIVDRASSLALGYVDKAENVVNLLRQQETNVTNQVLLRVRFAEVSRSAMQELGGSYFTGPNGKGDWIARGTTQQYAAPDFEKDKGLVFSDFLNLFMFNTEEQLGAVIRALKGRGLFQSLAEPNLITQDGKEASFLAGGEYPYPVVQGGTGGGSSAVTIVFKEFGVRLRFTPVVTADGMIQLKVAPEVSSLDFGNAVVLEGFRVPALATRRTETNVELRDGQTFAIAGMIDQNLNETLRRVPGLGDIPVLGYLFRSQAYQKNATELVVMITPHIIRRDSPGVTPNLPGLVQPFLPGTTRRTPPPPPAFTTPMTSSVAPTSPTASTFAPGASADRTAGRPTQAPVATAAVASAPTTKVVASSSAPPSPIAMTPAKPAVAAPVPAASAKPAVAPMPKPTVAPTPNKEEREAAQKAAKLIAEHAKRTADQARKDEQKRQQEEKKAAELRRKEDEIAAREAAIQARKDGERARLAAKELERTRKTDLERQEIERRVAEKRAAEQQVEAARIKEIADKLAKEKANRDAELEKLVTQYQKLTEGQQTSPR